MRNYNRLTKYDYIKIVSMFRDLHLTCKENIYWKIIVMRKNVLLSTFYFLNFVFMISNSTYSVPGPRVNYFFPNIPTVIFYIKLVK